MTLERPSAVRSTSPRCMASANASERAVVCAASASAVSASTFVSVFLWFASLVARRYFSSAAVSALRVLVKFRSRTKRVSWTRCTRSAAFHAASASRMDPDAQFWAPARRASSRAFRALPRAYTGGEARPLSTLYEARRDSAIAVTDPRDHEIHTSFLLFPLGDRPSRAFRRRRLYEARRDHAFAVAEPRDLEIRTRRHHALSAADPSHRETQARREQAFAAMEPRDIEIQARRDRAFVPTEPRDRKIQASFPLFRPWVLGSAWRSSRCITEPNVDGTSEPSHTSLAGRGPIAKDGRGHGRDPAVPSNGERAGERYFLWPIIFLASMACSTAVFTFVAVVLAASALDFASRYFSELKAVSASAIEDSAVARSAFICSRSAWVPFPLGALSSNALASSTAALASVISAEASSFAFCFAAFASSAAFSAFVFTSAASSVAFL